MRRIDLKKANAARSNTIRDINRQIVLNYVRELGPISRADIARETALQRSTISLIVDELSVDGLIEEVSGESTGGRPPSLLSLRTADAVAIGVDLGTVKTVMASSDLAGRVLEQEEFPTDNDVKKTLAAIVHRALIIALAARHRLPAVYPYRFFATDGGLMSYGVDLLDLFRRSAGYVDRVLKGEKPADLPVQAPVKFELVINLKAAKALGLDVPYNVLILADKVID